MTFEELLIATLDNSNQIREQAEFTINQYKEEDYQHFLSKITKHILKTSNPTSFYISFIIILQDIRSGKLFEDKELFYSFLPNFLDVLQQIFISDKLNDVTCNILSTILISMSKLASTNIDHFLILSIEQIPDLQYFFIDTLASIFFESENISTPFDVLVAILTFDSNSNYIDYNSKFFLILSIIRHFPDNTEDIYSILSQFITEIPDESVKYVLSLFSRYFNTLKLFFCEIFDDIFTFITDNFENYQDEIAIQAEAIDCLTSISISYKDSYNEIYNILLVILQIIETESDKDSEIGPVLKGSIHNMSNGTSPLIFLTALSNIHEEKKCHFSYLIAISELDKNAAFQLYNRTVEYYNEIASFFDDSTIDDFFRVKMAAYLALENLCCILRPMFQEDNLEELFSLLWRELSNETDANLIQLNLRCFSIFLKKIQLNELNDEVASLFTFLVDMFLCSDDEIIMTEIIDLIRYLARSLSSMFIEFYPPLIDMISQIDFSKQPDLVVPILRLCDVCVTRIQKIILKGDHLTVQKVDKEAMVPLFECALEYRGKAENESDFDYVSRAIISFVSFLRSLVSPLLVSRVVPSFLAAASAEVEITHLPEGHGIESIPGFIRVSPFDFAKESTIKAVSFALETIQSSISVLKADFRPFTEATLEVASGWISHRFPLGGVQLYSWAILDQLNKEDPSADLGVTFSLFQCTFCEEAGPEASDVPFIVLMNALAIGIERQRVDADVLAQLFESFLSRLRFKLANAGEEEDEETDGPSDLKNETKFFNFCLKKLPEATVEFVGNEIVPLLPQLFECGPFSEFVIKVTTRYVIESHDLDLFDDFGAFLFDSFECIESERAQFAMKSIGKLFESKELTFSEEFYIDSYKVLIDMLSDPDSYENDSFVLLNEAIISFTKLIANHSNLLDDSDEIDLGNGLAVWFGLIPKLLNNKKNGAAFDFLAFLICQKTDDVLDIIEPSALIKLLLDSIGKMPVDKDNKQIFISFIKDYFAEEGNPFSENELDEDKNLKLQKILQSD